MKNTSITTHVGINRSPFLIITAWPFLYANKDWTLWFYMGASMQTFSSQWKVIP